MVIFFILKNFYKCKFWMLFNKKFYNFRIEYIKWKKKLVEILDFFYLFFDWMYIGISFYIYIYFKMWKVVLR